MRKQYGENADKLMELFRKTYPTHDILDLAFVDNIFRAPAVASAKKKASYGSNNTYVFLRLTTMRKMKEALCGMVEKYAMHSRAQTVSMLQMKR